jgi:hypothetical protein
MVCAALSRAPATVQNAAGAQSMWKPEGFVLADALGSMVSCNQGCGSVQQTHRVCGRMLVCE